MTLKPILILLAALSGPALAQDTDPAAEPTVAPPRDALVTLINNSGAMVMHFFATPVLPEPESSGQSAGIAPTATAAPTESADLLAGGVISPGSNAVLNLPGGADICTFTLRFELRDQRIVQGSADVCASDVYVIE